MKGQETYTKFKVKYNKKETLHSITPLGEETSILTVDSERMRTRRRYGSRPRTNHLLQLRTTRTLSKGLLEPLHYLQLLQFLRTRYRDCPVLLAKLEERRGPQQNPQVQLIYVEPRREDPRVIVITRGGIVTGEYRLTQGKTTEESGIRKAAEKTQTFDAKKERQIFEEERKEFKEDQGSSSKTRPEVREYGMPLEFD
jgi:hypothetical protein